MRRWRPVVALVAVALLASACQQVRVPAPGFRGTVYELDAETRSLMTGRSWRPGCPVGLDDLRLLTVTHWGFDGRRRQGELVVHRDWAEAVLDVLRQLYDAGFPIERMRLVDHYGADDNSSMADNNTSAFNCRPVTSGSSWSKHSYGTAIDINPVQNPYVRGATVLPPAGAPHATTRDPRVEGLIVAGGPVTTAFEGIGWTWGGTWTSPKDWQHVEAPEGAVAPGVSTGRTPAAAGAAANVDGRLEVAMVDRRRGLVHLWQQCASCGWSPVVPLDVGSGPIEGTVALAANADGRLEVFGADPAGSLGHAWQTCAGCGWSEWADFGGAGGPEPVPRGGGVAAIRDAGGRLVVSAIDAGGRAWVRRQAGGGWESWVLVGGPDLVGTPALGVTGGDRLELFATAADGWMWHAWEQSPGGDWSAWAPFVGGVAGSPTVVANHDGRLEVAALGRDRGVGHAWQQSVGGSWSGWYAFDATPFRGDPVLARIGDGRLELFVEAEDRSLWHAWQQSAGGAWSAWYPLAGELP